MEFKENNQKKRTLTEKKIIQEHLLFYAVFVLFFISVGFAGAWAYERYLIKIEPCSSRTDSKICYQVESVNVLSDQRSKYSIENLDPTKKYRLVVKRKVGNDELTIGESIIDLAHHCYDTDGGRNIYEPGDLSWPVQQFSASDSCNYNTLTEYYCTTDNYKEEKIECPFGCENGACKPSSGETPTTPESGCTDTDGGRNYSISGSARGELDGVYGAYYDECEVSSNQLIEYYCEGGVVNKIAYQCPVGCAEAKCTQDPNICTDDDSDTLGEKNYFVKGHTSWPVQSFEFQDECLDTKTLREGYCGSGGGMTIDYACPMGCENGACKPIIYGHKCEIGDMCLDTSVAGDLTCKPSGSDPNKNYCCLANQCASAVPGTNPSVHCVDTKGADYILDGSGNVQTILGCVTGNYYLYWSNNLNTTRSCYQGKVLVNDVDLLDPGFPSIRNGVICCNPGQCGYNKKCYDQSGVVQVEGKVCHAGTWE